MTEYKRPTAQATELFDPLLEPAPLNVSLLLVSPGGVLIEGPWFDGCIAWGYRPKLPQSVKDRLNAIKPL